MTLQKLFLSFSLCAFTAIAVGCGGGDPPVADAPPPPEPELTPEEEAAEEEYINSGQ